MRWSQIFTPTLREEPADAEVVSHKLLLRSGMIRQLAAGIYSYLPLAKLSLHKIETIIREEMASVGGQEFYLPALNPREIWEESGRWDVMGDNMFRLVDRKGAEFCLAMTHEEIFTGIARNELRSYKQLPQIWYQIQTKFRDEARPKSGLLRVRQFTMKDSYSFDLTQDGLDIAFEKHREAYKKIFSRCGLKFVMVEASSGSMGGAMSIEFMVRTNAGEDLIAVSENGNYAANMEKATSKLPPAVDEASTSVQEFPTPGIKTIEDLATAFDFAPADRQVKTLVYWLDRLVTVSGGVDIVPQPFIVLLRGDHQLNETKLVDSVGALSIRPATEDEIFDLLGAHPGSLGAVALKGSRNELSVVADAELRGRRNLVTGSNRDGFHLKGVDIDRDIAVDKWDDFRLVSAGEISPDGQGRLEIYKALEIGHIFKLGTKYSVSMGATVLDESGIPVPIVMGSYGIGVERILAACIEQGNDSDGIVFPKSVAPFEVVISITDTRNPNLNEVGEQLYSGLQKRGIDVLLDDRSDRAGVKFKDADLIGIPLRVNIGKRTENGLVELINRRTKAVEETTIERALSRIIELLETYDDSLYG